MTDMVIKWQTPSTRVSIFEEIEAGTSSSLLQGPRYASTPDMPSAFPLSSSQAELQARLRARLPRILEDARNEREIYPDPIDAMGQLLNNLGVDYDTWRTVLDERFE